MPKLPEVDVTGWSPSTDEHERLVRFCCRLTGDPSAAEDLAQETLSRAWQHRHQLRDPERRAAWLNAIARNVYRRWLKDRKRASVDVPLARTEDWSEVDATVEPSDDADLEVELERDDLARLLDRAMRLLPTETRQVLVQRYVEELPEAEIGHRLGLTEGAVAMRVRRGKLALRRVLATAFREDVVDYGLTPGESDPWRTTRIWCPLCGRLCLEGIFIQSLGLFRLRCPDCGALNNSFSTSLFVGVKGYYAALTRLLDWVDWLYKHSLTQPTVPCPGCGRVLVLRKDVSDGARLISYYCTRCRGGTWNGQCNNILALPETRGFWRKHPRMRALPDREVETAGRRAVVAGFESLTNRERLEVVYARDTLDLIAIHQASPSR